MLANPFFAAALVGLTGTAAQAALNPLQQEFQDSLRAKVPELNTLTGMSLRPEDIYVFDGVADAVETPASERRDDEVVPADYLSDVREANASAEGALGLAMRVYRSVVREGDRDVVYWDESRSGHQCLIYFSTHGLAQTGRDRESTLYHELFHCYQYRAAAAASLGSMGEWFIEGLAEWVGEQLSGGTELGGSRFFKYLNPATDMPLLERAYDAFPFYAHLARWTAPSLVFADFRDWMITAATLGTSRAIFEAVVSRDPNFLTRSWATGIWRAAHTGRPEWGTDWNTDVPGSPTGMPTFRKGVLSPGNTAYVDAYRPSHLQFDPADETFYRLTFKNVWGKVRIVTLSGATQEIELNGEEVSFKVCMGLECKCPSGARPLDDDEVIRVGEAPIPIAVVAREAVGEVRAEVVQPTCCGDRRIDPRLVGTWSFDSDEGRLLAWGGVDLERCMEFVSGTHTIRIDEFGGVTKTYSDLQFSKSCRFSGTTTIEYVDRIDGTVRGCLSVAAERSWEGDPLLAVDFQQVSDNVFFYHAEDGRRLPQPDGWEGEPHYLQFGVSNDRSSDQSGMIRIFRTGQMSHRSTSGLKLYQRAGL